MINHSVNGLTQIQSKPVAANVESKSPGGFTNMLSSMMAQVNDTQLDGDRAIEQLQSGKAEHLHEVMIAVEEADISLRMAVQIRNKALTAYEEIMRMQL